jgi:hypothetical protein
VIVQILFVIKFHAPPFRSSNSIHITGQEVMIAYHALLKQNAVVFPYLDQILGSRSGIMESREDIIFNKQRIDSSCKLQGYNLITKGDPRSSEVLGLNLPYGGLRDIHLGVLTGW